MCTQPCGPPISFLYLHFHDAIRKELEDVQSDVRSLERAPEGAVPAMLLGLRERCRFLEQVHSYHSSVEDEVCGGGEAVHGGRCHAGALCTYALWRARQ